MNLTNKAWPGWEEKGPPLPAAVKETKEKKKITLRVGGAVGASGENSKTNGETVADRTTSEACFGL